MIYYFYLCPYKSSQHVSTLVCTAKSIHGSPIMFKIPGTVSSRDGFAWALIYFQYLWSSKIKRMSLKLLCKKVRSVGTGRGMLGSNPSCSAVISETDFFAGKDFVSRKSSREAAKYGIWTISRFSLGSLMSSINILNRHILCTDSLEETT